MNILMLSAIVPTPSFLPGSPRAFCFARELSSMHEVSLVLLPGFEIDERNVEVLRESGVYTSIERFPELTPVQPGLKNRLIHFLNNGWHLSQCYLRPEYLARARARILEICREQAIDVIYADGLALAQYVPDEYVDRTFMDLCDSLSAFYIKAAAARTRRVDRYKAERAVRAVRREEQRAIRRFPVTTVISEVERSAVSGHAPAEKVHVICNGTDSDYFHPTTCQPERGHLVFFGVMNFFPNADGALHFVRDLFPRIRAALPEATVAIVGKGPAPELQAENGKGGVTITGEVDDIRPWVHRAEAFVCPLRIGAGVKNKLLAAMAMKVPVICSRLSLDGVAAVPGTHLLVADTPEEYLAAIRSLRESPGRREALIENGYNLVIDHYSWKSKRKELNEVLERVTGSRRPEVSLV
jgi:glycosyltransferase involved in cell wall biosynthesis